ncbi:MAG: hypothetical protein AAF637_04470 [Pseudomonadota bacterium]
MNLSPSEPAHVRIGRAEAYPYDRPSVAYLFDAGMIRPLGPDWHVERTAVVACGSNGAPSRLAQKFADGDAQIPVTPAWLHGQVVVYSAHFTSYGALPATLHACPGAQTRLSITWLTAGQLERMHQSEGAGERYDYVELDQLELVVDGHGAVTRAGAYVSRRGPLTSDGEPVRLAEVITRDCPLRAYPQRAMLRRAHRNLAPNMTYPAFMTRILESPAYRREATARLETSGMARDAMERGAL